ncbi:MAG: ParA family protein [Clostridia bacterium]|nr:ParA family protein [Clostridia bacterium]
MAKVIAFSNQKGGVGKTTSCVNIAAALGKAGHRVLLVDLDPQGNATSGIGVAKKSIKTNIYDVLANGAPVHDAIIVTKFKNLHAIASTVDLAGAELELREELTGESCALSVFDPIRENYDYILIDCPPSLGMLTMSALSYANGVVIPLQCEFFALEGLSQLLMTIKRVRKQLNPKLEITGILLTMYNGRLTLTKQVIDELKKYYADKLFKTPISRSVKLSEAPGFGAPICYYDPTSKGAEEYKAVAKELVKMA